MFFSSNLFMWGWLHIVSKRQFVFRSYPNNWGFIKVSFRAGYSFRVLFTDEKHIGGINMKMHLWWLLSLKILLNCVVFCIVLFFLQHFDLILVKWLNDDVKWCVFRLYLFRLLCSHVNSFSRSSHFPSQFQCPPHYSSILLLEDFLL